MKHFKTKEELIKEWETNGACESGKEFNKSCKDLQEILETCPLKFRLWRIEKGYFQFAEHCQWDDLKSNDWVKLLSYQPQFSDKCNWDKFTGFAWSYLLSYQPQFSEKCDWNKLNGDDWGYILENQPQFADKCDWKKLDDFDWFTLLEHQPQLEKYKPKQ